MVPANFFISRRTYAHQAFCRKLRKTLFVGFKMQLTYVEGAPYDYVADVGMKSFAEAPKAIMKALGRLTWAGKFAFKLVGMDSCQKPNELLAVGYKEGNEMNVSSMPLR